MLSWCKLRPSPTASGGRAGVPKGSSARRATMWILSASCCREKSFNGETLGAPSTLPQPPYLRMLRMRLGGDTHQLSVVFPFLGPPPEGFDIFEVHLVAIAVGIVEIDAHGIAVGANPEHLDSLGGELVANPLQVIEGRHLPGQVVGSDALGYLVPGHWRLSL